MPSLNTKLASAPNTQTNYVLKATSSTTIGNSLIQDDGTNVAIGTTPATYKLNVNGTLGVTGAATLSSSVTANGVMSLSDDGTYGSNYKTLGFTGNTNGNHRIFAGVTDGMFICSKTGEGIFFRVNGGTTNNLTISSAGNVGIGTSSPESKLQVEGGELRVTTSNAGVAAYYTAGNGELAAYNWGGAAWIPLSYAGQYHIWRNSGNEVMRITSGGKVGINGYDTGVQLYVKSTTTGSSDYPLYLANSSVGIFYVRSDGYISTGTASGSPYNNTSGAAANMVVNSGGGIERSTSSLKYKKEIRDYDKGLAEVMAMRPVYYKGKNPNDGDKQFAGLIAEEIDALGLNEFVTYAEDGSPDALAYQNMIALLVKAIQNQQEQINQLINK